MVQVLFGICLVLLTLYVWRLTRTVRRYEEALVLVIRAAMSTNADIASMSTNVDNHDVNSRRASEH